MNDRVVVVTGASRGIGFAVAEKFASQGFAVFLGGTNEQKLKEAADFLSLKYKVNCNYHASDLSTETGCHSFSKAVLDVHSEIHVLVNNAGLFLGGKMMEEDSIQFRKMMELNLFSAYHITKDLWNLFAKNAKSHVFNMCSIASFTAYPAGGSYSVSKFALLGFSKSLRLEGMEKGIAVTAVMPGATLTDSWAGVDLPNTRFMKTDDVAEVIFTSWKVNDFTVTEEIILRPFLGDI